MDELTKETWIECQGMNDKNHCPRKTPCDQDTLRKAVKDVAASENKPLVRKLWIVGRGLDRPRLVLESLSCEFGRLEADHPRQMGPQSLATS